MSVVYSATCLVNGKKYIGKTLQRLSARRTAHERAATSEGSELLFHRALRKYGVGAFSWKVVARSESEEMLGALEVEAIKQFNTITPNGYNMTGGGDGGLTGFKHSAETRRKMSESAKKLGPKSPEVRKKLSESVRGFKHREEAKRKISQAHKGRKCKPRSATTRQKLREAQLGKKASKETREKLSKLRTGKQHSEETKRKISESQKGKVISEETRKKISATKKGKKLSEEQKAKLRGPRKKQGPKSVATKRKISEAKKGKPWSVARRRAQARKCQRYDLSSIFRGE